MSKNRDLTEGNILKSLIGFTLPVLLSLFLQALYGGADLFIVGQFAETADVSGVATGSMLMQTITMVIAGLAMGITITVAERVGERRPEDAGRAIGAGLLLFFALGVLMTFIVPIFSDSLAKLLNAPEESMRHTSLYIRICGIGSLFIIAYNILGSIFRGIGDAKTPLLTVAIACVINIVGDLLLVAVFGMGAVGAAIATVAAQAISVLLSLLIIRRRSLPFELRPEMIRFEKRLIGSEIKLGLPVALQELLVGISFLVIQTVVNSFGVVASAGVGVAEKVCMFIMLVPSAYMQSMSAFVAQNMGAGDPGRAKKALRYGIITSFIAGAVMGLITFFWGDMLSLIFAKDMEVIRASHSYLKAYAIDCALTPFLFCFMGYYNGIEKTVFVMAQGIIGAFLVRVPVVYAMSRISGVSLFEIGLGTPASTLVQITLCVVFFVYLERRSKKAAES